MGFIVHILKLNHTDMLKYLGSLEETRKIYQQKDYNLFESYSQLIFPLFSSYSLSYDHENTVLRLLIPTLLTLKYLISASKSFT